MFSNKMGLAIRARTFNYVKHHHAICLKLVFISLTNKILEPKASICFIFTENLLLFCFKFSAFVIAIII